MFFILANSVQYPLIYGLKYLWIPQFLGKKIIQIKNTECHFLCLDVVSKFPFLIMEKSTVIIVLIFHISHSLKHHIVCWILNLIYLSNFLQWKPQPNDLSFFFCCGPN